MSCNRKGKSCKTGIAKGTPNRKWDRQLYQRQLAFDQNPPLCHGSPMTGTGHRPGSGKSGRNGGKNISNKN